MITQLKFITQEFDLMMRDEDRKMGFGLMMRDQHGAEINKAFRVSMHNPDMTLVAESLRALADWAERQ